MPSPFDKKGGTATATKTAASVKAEKAKAEAADPTQADVTNVGEDKPVVKGDPFNASDPSGISGYKPLFFLGQLVLMHASEFGNMKTSSNTPENPTSEYVRFDIIPLTTPQPGPLSNQVTTVNDEGEFVALNKDGEAESCEAYEVGERLEDVLIFNKALVREGKKALDKGTSWLLGRIVKGNKKAGQSAPYILVAGDDDDKAIYQEWREKAVAAAK